MAALANNFLTNPSRNSSNGASNSSRTSSNNGTRTRTNTSNGKTKKNNTNIVPHTSEEMLSKLSAIFEEAYVDTPLKKMTTLKWNILLNNFLPKTMPSIVNQKINTPDNIKTRLELYKDNFMDATKRINAALDNGTYNVNKVLLHGEFPTTSARRIMFKREVVPENIVLCFLTSLSRESTICGYLNPINEFPRIFPIGATNENKKKNQAQLNY